MAYEKRNYITGIQIKSCQIWNYSFTLIYAITCCWNSNNFLIHVINIIYIITSGKYLISYPVFFPSVSNEESFSFAWKFIRKWEYLSFDKKWKLIWWICLRFNLLYPRNLKRIMWIMFQKRNLWMKMNLYPKNYFVVICIKFDYRVSKHDKKILKLTKQSLYISDIYQFRYISWLTQEIDCIRQANLSTFCNYIVRA